jgi:hypothetical protein
LLLGYLKLADSSTLLLQCIEVSNRLREYVEAQQKSLRSEEEKTNILRIMKEEIEKVLIEYASSKDI